MLFRSPPRFPTRNEMRDPHHDRRFSGDARRRHLPRRRHHLRCRRAGGIFHRRPRPRGASLPDVTKTPADGRRWLRRHHTMPCTYGAPTPLSRWPPCVASLPEAVDTNQAPGLTPHGSGHRRSRGYPDPDPVTLGVNTASCAKPSTFTGRAAR